VTPTRIAGISRHGLKNTVTTWNRAQKHDHKTQCLKTKLSHSITKQQRTTRYLAVMKKCMRKSKKLKRFRQSKNTEDPDLPMTNSVYPVTIIKSRYGGTYSGAKWLAFNLYHSEIPDAATGSDTECITFWEKTDLVVGKGSSSMQAYLDLLKQKSADEVKSEVKVVNVTCEEEDTFLKVRIRYECYEEFATAMSKHFKNPISKNPNTFEYEEYIVKTPTTMCLIKAIEEFHEREEWKETNAAEISYFTMLLESLDKFWD